MAEQYVTGETLVGEIVTQYPEAVEILLSIGMHCLGCPSARGETVEEACMVHGIDCEAFLKQVNRFIEACEANQ